jgi:hypothetical protein
MSVAPPAESDWIGLVEDRKACSRTLRGYRWAIDSARMRSFVKFAEQSNRYGIVSIGLRETHTPASPPTSIVRPPDVRSWIALANGGIKTVPAPGISCKVGLLLT